MKKYKPKKWNSVWVCPKHSKQAFAEFEKLFPDVDVPDRLSPAAGKIKPNLRFD